MNETFALWLLLTAAALLPIFGLLVFLKKRGMIGIRRVSLVGIFFTAAAIAALPVILRCWTHYCAIPLLRTADITLILETLEPYLWFLAGISFVVYFWFASKPTKEQRHAEKQGWR